jgi:FkbM family methyltransferase
MGQKNFSEIELLLRWVDSKTDQDNVLVDVGAHVGSSMLPFAKRKWRVYAFEPEPTNYQELKTKFKNFSNVTCIAKAVSDTNQEKVPFYTSSKHWGIHALQPFHPTHQPSLTVETVRLDDALVELGVNKVTVLKVDIEGADFLALKTFDFKRFRPDVAMCEFMDDRSKANFGYTHDDVANYMATQGYATFVAEWGPIVEYGRRGSVSTNQHRFLQCRPYPLDHQPAWGNLIFIPEAEKVNFVNTLSKYLNDLKKSNSIIRPALKKLRRRYLLVREKFRGLETGLLASILLLIYSLSSLPGNKITAFLTLVPFFFVWRRRMVRLFRNQQARNFVTDSSKNTDSKLERVVNLIDVGSAGDLPHPWRENADKILYLLKFEPRDEADDENPFIKTLDVALWEANEERDFYIGTGNANHGSSLFHQNHEYVVENFETIRHRGPKQLADTWLERSQIERIERVQCYRLDDVLQTLDSDVQYHFLKIDAQGAEYQILKGAEKFLKQSCQGLHLELFELPLYKNIVLLPDVVVYLEKMGFDLVKKFPAHGSFDSQHDCIFLKRGCEGQVMDTIKKIYGL